MKTTTIQIQNPTKELLNELKENWHLQTYDDVIKTLVKKKTQGMYGAFSTAKKISFKEMMKDVRDKHDRF